MAVHRSSVVDWTSCWLGHIVAVAEAAVVVGGELVAAAAAVVVVVVVVADYVAVHTDVDAAAADVRPVVGVAHIDFDCYFAHIVYFPHTHCHRHFGVDHIFHHILKTISYKSLFIGFFGGTLFPITNN